MTPNPPGYIPVFGQGLRAKEKQEGTDGGMKWLKIIKLHKYWPTFSQWSYSEFMSLRAENVEELLARTGSSGMTEGAKGRLLKAVESLRARESSLDLVTSSARYGLLETGHALQVLKDTVWSPLPDSPGSSVASALVTAVIGVQCFLMNRGLQEPKMHDVINVVLKRPILIQTMRMMQKNIQNLNSLDQYPEQIIDAAPIGKSTPNQDINSCHSEASSLSFEEMALDGICIDKTPVLGPGRGWQDHKPVPRVLSFDEMSLEDISADKTPVLKPKRRWQHKKSFPRVQSPEDAGTQKLEDEDWFRPSSEKEGIWPQGENSVMLTVWPRSLLEHQADNSGSSYLRVMNHLSSAMYSAEKQ